MAAEAKDKDANEEGVETLRWQDESRQIRKTLGIPDVSVKPWTGRANVHLRGLPKQISPEFCFQNECPTILITRLYLLVLLLKLGPSQMLSAQNEAHFPSPRFRCLGISSLVSLNSESKSKVLAR